MPRARARLRKLSTHSPNAGRAVSASADTQGMNAAAVTKPDDETDATEAAGDVTTPAAVVDTGEAQPEPRVSATAAVTWLLVAGAAARAA